MCNIHWRFFKCRWLCACFLTESLLWCIDVSVKYKGHCYSWQDTTSHCQSLNFSITMKETWIFALLCQFSISEIIMLPYICIFKGEYCFPSPSSWFLPNFSDPPPTSAAPVPVRKTQEIDQDCPCGPCGYVIHREDFPEITYKDCKS